MVAVCNMPRVISFGNLLPTFILVTGHSCGLLSIQPWSEFQWLGPNNERCGLCLHELQRMVAPSILLHTTTCLFICSRGCPKSTTNSPSFRKVIPSMALSSVSSIAMASEIDTRCPVLVTCPVVQPLLAVQTLSCKPVALTLLCLEWLCSW